MSSVKDFKCNNCGAPLPIPKNSKGHVKCPSCKTECVIEGLVKNAEMADKENINSGYPLFASSAQLHKNLLTFLSESPSMPLDIFEKGEIVREEHHCVPAFLFYCNGTTSYTYEAGNVRQHKTAIDLGDKTRIETENYLEWTQMSGTANAKATVFVSGSKTLAPQIKGLYMFLETKKLVDYDELEFPHDVVTYDYNLPQATAFNDYVTPYMEKLLKEIALKSLKGKKYRDLTVAGGSRIDKDEITRVFLGLYRIVLKYNGKEYAIWVTGDGEKVISEGMPIDTERQKTLEEKQKAMEQALANVAAPATGGLNFGKWVCLIIGAFIVFVGITQGTAGYSETGLIFAFVGLIFIAGGIVLSVFRSKRKKEFSEKRSEIGAPFQKDIDSFAAQAKNVLDQFKAQKKGMRGIYEAEVTGNASAF
jgi:hypothetical protein